MMGERLRTTAPVAPMAMIGAESSVRPLSDQSGIYRHGRADPFRQAQRADDDDQITSVYHAKPITPQPEVQTRLEQAPGSLWQIGMLLNGPELSQLWLQNAATLNGRAYVWSEHAQTWVTLQPPPRIEAARGTTTITHAERGASYAPIDVTQQAQLLVPSTRFGNFCWLGAAVLGLSAMALLPSRISPAISLPGATPPARSATSSSARLGASERPIQQQGVPAEALPLNPSTERAAQSIRPPPSHSTKLTAQLVSQENAPRPFDAGLARRALANARGNLEQCATGELSGTVYVTFEPSGHASKIRLGAISGDKSRLGCVASAFHGVKVVPFTGNSVIVKKRFQIGSSSNSMRVASPVGPKHRFG